MGLRRNAPQQPPLPEKLRKIFSGKLFNRTRRLRPIQPTGRPRRLRIGGRRQRPTRTSSSGIQALPRDHGIRGFRRITRTLQLRSRDQPQRRRKTTLGTNLPTLGSRTRNPQRVDQRHVTHRKNPALFIPCRCTYPLCAQTTWPRITPMCRLSRN